MSEFQPPASGGDVENMRRSADAGVIVMESKQRTGWTTALIALSVFVGAAFILFLIMTLAGILD